MNEPVAIVHDWLTSMRGAERVVEALYGVFPRADLFTLTWDPSRLSPGLARRRATTSAIHSVANAPFMSGRFRGLLPFFPRAVESFDLARYSLVVSSSHCVAIGALAPPSALHVAYVHSTMRYAREGQRSYEASVPGGHVGRAMFRGAAHYLRRWETEAAARPHALIANSSYTRERIRRYYQRDAEIIEPPIDTTRFGRAADSVSRAVAELDPAFLVVSALVPNKRVDLALRAFQGRKERLVVVGDGPERARLLHLAGPNVTLLPHVEEGELANLLARCRALVHPGVDDFGMVMVEALAAGKPVIACAEGGALDIVRDDETGLHIAAPTVEAVRQALDRFARRESGFDPIALRAFARRFDRAKFEERFAEAVEDARRRQHVAQGRPLRNRSAPARSPRRRPVPETTSAPRPGKGAATARTPEASRGARSVAKRVLDVALAASGLAMTAPLLAVFGALISLDSEGPALFFQPRTGLGQRPFTMVKLRTMDADKRVTAVGRWLRPMGLDELPQLWNVLRGDMSFIGPRPEVLSRVERYRCELPGYDTRHAVRPGITGLAQVRGLRGDNTGTIEERLKFDLQYVDEWSLRLDAQIAAWTIPRVLIDTIRARRG
jgi:lipopolysaccharide/colanic/teichoic acid biosynthesis glycosyltransferase/glycosyltransferase involved in cell wall biosynthesis